MTMGATCCARLAALMPADHMLPFGGVTTDKSWLVYM